MRSSGGQDCKRIFRLTQVPLPPPNIALSTRDDTALQSLAANNQEGLDILVAHQTKNIAAEASIIQPEAKRACFWLLIVVCRAD